MTDPQIGPQAGPQPGPQPGPAPAQTPPPESPPASATKPASDPASKPAPKPAPESDNTTQNGQTEAVSPVGSDAPSPSHDAKTPHVSGGGVPVVGAENLRVLENIDVKLSVEVGHTEIKIRDLLRLNEGSVIELDRLAGDPLDIVVNGTMIAKGEIVMVGERFGVRFTEIVDPEKRVESL